MSTSAKNNDSNKLGAPTKTEQYGSTTTNIQAQNMAMHMQTYTAGEDSRRLAEMAKEFGLQKSRRPREQVRRRVNVPLNLLRRFVHDRILDPEFANVRMRSIYTSSHGDDFDQLYVFEDDEELKDLMGRPPSWLEDLQDEGEEEGGGSGRPRPRPPPVEEDSHATGLGGDLPSAVLGIIKGMVGPAILYLPHGFANAGYAVAIPILILCTILFLRSSGCLLDSWKLESSKSARAYLLMNKKPKRTILSYPELAYRALGVPGETVVKIGIALMQSGRILLTFCFRFQIFS
jgi:proton-coupled amino acid transporter